MSRGFSEPIRQLSSQVVENSPAMSQGPVARAHAARIDEPRGAPARGAPLPIFAMQEDFPD